jgi:hypothetical protein
MLFDRSVNQRLVEMAQGIDLFGIADGLRDGGSTHHGHLFKTMFIERSERAFHRVGGQEPRRAFFQR